MLITFGFIFLLSVHFGALQDLGSSCVMKDTDQSGVCKLASECQSAREEFEKNGTRPTICKISPITLCCTNNITTPNTKPAKKRLSERKCDEYSRPTTESVSFLPLIGNQEFQTISLPTCMSRGVELIVTDNAYQGEFPHMAAIGWTNEDGKYTFQCGGSLISPKFVLTAGRCSYFAKMRDPRPTVVRLGDQNLNPTVDDGASPVDVRIKTIYKHPDYKAPIKYNDLALIELEKEVDFSENIRPACLWTNPDFPEQSRAVATGWEPFFARNRDTELQKDIQRVIENDECKEKLGYIFNRNFRELKDTQICTNGFRRRKDLCQFQYGSPLHVVSPDNICLFYIVGTSTEPGSCEPMASPTVYTKVSSYIDWIESIVWPEGQ